MQHCVQGNEMNGLSATFVYIQGPGEPPNDGEIHESDDTALQIHDSKLEHVSRSLTEVM